MAGNAVRDWLVAWFRANNAALADMPGDDLADADFFAAGYIDSMGVITLVGDVEAAFGIAFTETDFQDRRFSTVAGLAEIVGERIADAR